MEVAPFKVGDTDCACVDRAVGLGVGMLDKTWEG